MEFNEWKTDPPSTRELLYDQVKEQSDLCDITIKHGFWEKRFHWCVLVASPYFENIRRNSFIEKDLGIVSMTVATPVSLEEAILFLYGKKPRINMQNVGALLEVAEYLIIPELKGHCVKWIKSKSASVENCMTMLKLASLYNFDLLSYEEYLKGCIPDLIMTDWMMDLTPESVEYLFTDPTLSYVQTHDKFSFLVRWTNQRPDRIPLFGNLLKHIDFKDAKKDYLNNVVIYEPLIQKLENAADFINLLLKIDCHDYCDVLIFPNELENSKIQCFDLTRKRWCSVNIEIDNKPEQFQTYKIKECRCQRDVRGPYIYIILLEHSYNRKPSILTLNLEMRTVEGSEIEVDESYREKIKFNSELAYLWQDKVFIMSEERIQRPGLEQTGFDLHHIQLLLDAGIQVDPFLLHTVMGRRMIDSPSCSVLYIGSVQSERTLVQPILCIRDKITTLCANNTSLAMLSENAKHLYLYNIEDHSFDKLVLEFGTDRNRLKLDRVGSNCFVVYNNKCFTTIARQFGPNLREKYHVDQYKFRIADDVDRYYINFDLLSYEEYLKGCIPDLIMTDWMMDLTPESVEYLFTDPTLSYVQTHDKFSFLVRWTNQRPDRIPLFGNLLKHIDFKDAKKDYLNNVVIYEPLIQKLENAADFINLLLKIDCHDYCDVLIFPNELENSKIQCFDLTRKRWCSVNIEIDNKPEQFQTYKIKECRCQRDVRGPYIYIILLEHSYNRKPSILTLNLEMRTVEGSEIEVDESYREKIKFNSELAYLWQDKVFIMSEERIQRPGLEQTGFDLHHIQLLLDAGIQVDPFLLHTVMGRRMIDSPSCSVLYIGSVQSERTLVQPILCIRDKITTLCANNTSLAMLSENAKHLYLYNIEDHSFDKLVLEFGTDRNRLKLDRVGSNCFVVYNNKCFTTIARQFGPNLREKYHVDQYKFRIADDVDRYYINEYYMCENKWYHYSRLSNEETVFTVTTHDKLVASIQARIDCSNMDESGVWEQLTTDGYQRSYHSLGRNVLQIRLSKDRLSCAKYCPHCKVKEQSQRRVNYHDTDDNDSDDLYGDCYGYEDDYGYLERSFNVYGYDSDDYYYNSSD